MYLTLYLVYRLNFIIDVYLGGKNSIHRVLYYAWFQVVLECIPADKGKLLYVFYVLLGKGEKVAVWGTCAQLLRKTYVLLMLQASS